MITDPIVMVLGAGASIPYGFPSGTGLADDIIEECSRSDDPSPYRNYSTRFLNEFAQQLNDARS